MARQRWLSGEPLALQALSAAVLYGASAFLFLSFFLSQTSGNDEGWWISDKRPRVWHRQVCLRFYVFLIVVGDTCAYDEGENHSSKVLENSQVVHHCLVDGGLAGLGFAQDLYTKTVFSFSFSSYPNVFAFTHSFFPDTVMSSSGDTPMTSSLHFSFKY
ncbi:hypothetical protein F5141DRAFT_1097446 [Pisolithus sp. B1]|nr:hypothetical protein F5141DRAFT_1097446 [Pisolithus sp. B1]